MIEPEILQKIVAAHVNQIKKASELVSAPVVLTSPVVRLYYKKMIEQFVPDAVVLSYNEIEPSVQIQSIGTITIDT